jgi:asparagine synthase (glutamine-hydrolysing)
MEKYVEELVSILSKAVFELTDNNEKCAILFSGGLDSSIIAQCANKVDKAKITLYTVGTPGSHDISNGEKISRLMGLNWSKIEIEPEQILKAIPKLAEIIGSHHPVKISFELPMFFAMADIREDLIISGQGADELFGGYARYIKMEKKELKVELEKDIDLLISKDIKMEFALAEHFNKSLKIPYLQDDLVQIAKEIPIEYKVKNDERKIILKKVAMELGLPDEIINQDKKAAQYSSGIIKELRKIAKREKMTVNELIQHFIEK